MKKHTKHLFAFIKKTVFSTKKNKKILETNTGNLKKNQKKN